MHVHRDEEAWHFEGMDPFVVELLRELPGCAMMDDDKARRRICSSPTHGADQEADQEWRENVEPELRELFQSHVDVVVSDLAAMKTEGESSSIQIPAANARAWVHTLNQARLALGAKHDFTESELQGRRKARTNAKLFAVMQIDFYGMLLSLLLRHTEL
jgi:hypothetical protein